jgi:uncharacterized protein YndB with AHSA1/START domain
MDAAKSPGRMLQKRLGIRAPAAVVFRALTEAAELVHWFPTGAETDPRPGGAYRFRFESAEQPEQSRTREGTFLDVQPNKRLSFSWSAPLDLPGGDAGAPQTKVEFALSEKAGVTDLVLTHSGFGYGAGWDRSFERHSEEWAFYVLNLRSYLERGTDARSPGPEAGTEAGSEGEPGPGA